MRGMMLCKGDLEEKWNMVTNFQNVTVLVTVWCYTHICEVEDCEYGTPVYRGVRSPQMRN